MDLGCFNLIMASLPASLVKTLSFDFGPQRPEDSTTRGMHSQPNCRHFCCITTVLLSLFCLQCCWTWYHTRYLKGFIIKQGCDAKINCCWFAQLSVWDEDMFAVLHDPSCYQLQAVHPNMHAGWTQKKGCLGFCFGEKPRQGHFYKTRHTWWPKWSKEWGTHWGQSWPWLTGIPNHHLMATWNSEGSKWRLSPGEGVTDSQADEWHKGIKIKRALSGSEALQNSKYADPPNC